MMTEETRSEIEEFPLLSAPTAASLAEAARLGKKEVSVSLDLGLTEETVAIEGQELCIRDFHLPTRFLKKIVKRGTVAFALEDGDAFPLELREEGYYKLVPDENGHGAPTFEINGIKMHRTKDIDPFEDARTKAASVVTKGVAVLDTCGGLGYTATWARRMGASSVISCEFSENVIALRRYNPWSREYLTDPKTKKLHGDSGELIKDVRTHSIDVILHDPPRFSLAGHLYGEEFIAQMARVLTARGKLCFYTGEPYRAGRGREFIDGVVRRLKKGGIYGDYQSDIQCVVATKK